ncbi:MAG: FAD binding domain-containing protein [Acidimicrobiia bacterium]
MMRIRVYHRPSTLEETLALLARPDVNTMPLGGGTALNGLALEVPEEVVDLQALHLNQITRDGPLLRFGATARLQDVVDHEWTPPLLRDLAHAEAPNTLRNAATLGGTVATADPESGLLAGLLAHEAAVSIAHVGRTEEVALSDLLADRNRLAGGLITSVQIMLGGAGAWERTARTPADTPIVLVAGHRTEEGDVRLAATGVAPAPMVIDVGDIDELDPPSDFRGSSEYRSHLAAVLAARVVTRLTDGDGS